MTIKGKDEQNLIHQVADDAQAHQAFVVDDFPAVAVRRRKHTFWVPGTLGEAAEDGDQQVQNTGPRLPLG